jgi:hypothetical protein
MRVTTGTGKRRATPPQRAEASHAVLVTGLVMVRCADDRDEAVSAMERGTVVALVVYENTWAIPFVATARNSGGEMIASARIPATDVAAVLKGFESTA